MGNNNEINLENGKIKEIYFMILIQDGEKGKFKNLNFISEYTPKFINENKIENKEGSYIEYKVFKLKINIENNLVTENEKDNKVEFPCKIEFEIGEDNYIISFIFKGDTFIYDINFELNNEFLYDTYQETFDQNIIPFYDKFQIFLETLKKIYEIKKIDTLYKEAIELCRKSKDINILFFLFFHIYENYYLCSILLKTFREINDIRNISRDENLIKYIEDFKTIYLCSNDIINKNRYDTFNFYGIILSYLYIYDTDINFNEFLNNFYKTQNISLYAIITRFNLYFLNILNPKLDYYSNFLIYLINSNAINILEKSLNYSKDFKNVLIVLINIIENNNKKMINKKFKNFRPIKLYQLNLIKTKSKDNRQKEDEIKSIIDNINKIIEYSKNTKKLIIYFSDEFWIKLLKEYDIPDLENIDNCFKIRNLFKNYFNLINILYKYITNENLNDEVINVEETEDKFKYIIKRDLKRFYEKDEFAKILDKNIKNYIEKNNVPNINIIAIFGKYNPYYNINDKDCEQKYNNKRNVSIFDFLNFDKIEDNFIDVFKKLKFELIFKNNIKEFLEKLISKIKNIPNFGAVIELIDIKRISKENIKDYYDLLKKKFDNIKNKIRDNKDKDIKVLSKFIKQIFLYEKNCAFLNERIDKLNNKLKILIYNNLIQTIPDNEFKDLKDYIYDFFVKKVDNIDNIITFINILSGDKSKFLEKLYHEYKFKKEEFFSGKENKKVKFICNLSEKLSDNIKLKKEIFENIFDIYDIYKDLENNNLLKNQLEEFIRNINKKEDVIQKIGLMKIIIDDYNPDKKYKELNELNNEMNDAITELDSIKNSLLLFHKNYHRDNINEISKIIEIIKTKPISEFKKDRMKNSLNNIRRLKTLSDEIDSVKNLFIFEIIIKNVKGNDEEKRFENAKEKLDNLKESFQDNQDIEKIIGEDNIFNIIKEELSKKDKSYSDEFIKQIINYFNIEEKEIQNNLKILIKSKIFEKDIKSMKYFFENLNIKKLSIDIPKDLELSKMNLKDLKSYLSKLENKNIYDYKSNNYYCKIFTSLYKKIEALDFLKKKLYINIDYLKERLDPTQRTLKIKHIDDINECLKCLGRIINMDEKDILIYLKKLKKDEINCFMSYSQIYKEIINLDIYYDKHHENIFKKVNNIITNSTWFNDSIIFIENGKYNSINIEELIYLKNQINFEYKYNEEENKKNIKYKNILEIKSDKLIFFKNLVSDLEDIYNKIKNLRIKGCNISIPINIEIQFPKKKYSLKTKTSLNDINKILFDIKNDYENQLDIIYKNDKYLRFLYGKLFIDIQMNIINNYDINDIQRYILNITDNNIKINDAIIDNLEFDINDYSNNNQKYFENISKYIETIFKININLDEHYKKILIKEKNKYKGIYLQKSENISTKEYILSLFYRYLEQLPIAQNILICNKDTSIEELESFFYRAILCEYNSLFVVEIMESFTLFQYNKIYTFIYNILSFKFESFKKQNKYNGRLDKLRTKDYLNSCIVFIYSGNLKKELKEIEKYEFDKLDRFFIDIEQDKDNIYNNNLYKILKTENIKIISSELCGLGKSFLIKKMIKEKKQSYYHFPLGGILSKKIISEKLRNLMKNIKENEKKKEKEEYKNISIHIDLLDSKDTLLINEFLFSILITKFYINNDEIIYIPKDINIYIEIPNCFHNYLSEIGILNIFNIENIIIGQLKPNKKKNITNTPMAKLELEKEIRDNFKRIIGKETNEEIEEFIKNNIGIKEYSYHQIQMFIKLFLCQFNNIEGKIKFIDSNGKDLTDKMLQNTISIAKYCANGTFSNLLMNKNISNNDKLYESLDSINNNFNNFEINNLFFMNIANIIFPLINDTEGLPKINQDNEPEKSNEV